MPEPQPGYSRAFLNSRREAGWILVAFLVSMIWTVGAAAFLGYQPYNGTTILGFPSWIFWSVALPWIGCTVFTVWFSMRVMTEDPMDEPETND